VCVCASRKDYRAATGCVLQISKDREIFLINLNYVICNFQSFFISKFLYFSLSISFSIFHNFLKTTNFHIYGIIIAFIFTFVNKFNKRDFWCVFVYFRLLQKFIILSFYIYGIISGRNVEIRGWPQILKQW